MTTFIRAFAIMIALTGFSATTYTGGSSSRGNVSANAMTGGSGPTGGPVCTNNLPNCGLD